MPDRCVVCDAPIEEVTAYGQTSWVDTRRGDWNEDAHNADTLARKRRRMERLAKVNQ